MKHASLALAAALSVATLAAHAETPDPAGQFAATTNAAAPAQVYQKGAENPWASSYNPLKNFRGQKTRAQVEAEFIANRKAVQAMTSEDSGSAYLAAHQGTANGNQFAGQPARNAQ